MIRAPARSLQRFLSRGNDSREFDIDDVIDTAGTVYAALALFQLPVFMGPYPLEELEQRAGAVASLLVQVYGANDRR